MIKLVVYILYPFIHLRYRDFWSLKSIILKSKNNIVKKILIGTYKQFMKKHAAGIAHNSIFKGQPIFPHGLNGIFISRDAVIGKDCVIFHQVTIGSNNLIDSKRKGAPVIGDAVYIGAGAKIIGKVCIGNNVRIGANCVVFNDVPDNTVVVLNAPRLIEKQNMDNHFYLKGEDEEWYYFKNGKKVKK